MNADNQFKFKLNNFHSNLETGFYDLLKKEVMVDVILVTNGKILKAHKTILAISSQYFQEIFINHPCKHPVVILKDVSFEVMNNMLDFMYRGEADVQQRKIESFLKLGKVLKVKNLIEDEVEKVNELPLTLKASEKLPEPAVCEKKTETLVIELDDSEPDDSNNAKDEEILKKEESSNIISQTSNIKSSNQISPKAQPVTIVNQKPIEEIILEDDNYTTNEPLVDLNLYTGINHEYYKDHTKSDDNLKSSSLFNTQEMDLKTTADFSYNQKELPLQVPQNIKKQKGPKPSLIWEYFHRGYDKSVCKECGKTYKGYRINNNCSNHLKRKHPKLYKIFMANRRKRALLQGKLKWLRNNDDDDAEKNFGFSPLRANFEYIAGTSKNEEKTISETPQGVKKQQRRKRSFIYDYFDKYPNYSVCKNCGQTYSGGVAYTICRKHLENKHPDLYKELLAKKKKNQESESKNFHI